MQQRRKLINEGRNAIRHVCKNVASALSQQVRELQGAQAFLYFRIFSKTHDDTADANVETLRKMSVERQETLALGEFIGALAGGAYNGEYISAYMPSEDGPTMLHVNVGLDPSIRSAFGELIPLIVNLNRVRRFCTESELCNVTEKGYWHLRADADAPMQGVCHQALCAKLREMIDGEKVFRWTELRRKYDEAERLVRLL